jgi:hypothetical protein
MIATRGWAVARDVVNVAERIGHLWVRR